jgi:ABC-2 type transport system permease protein
MRGPPVDAPTETLRMPRARWPLGLRKYVLAGSIALRNRWAYRADVAGLVFTYGLFVFVFSNLWAVAYAGKARLAGYDQRQLTWYFIVSELLLFSMGQGPFTALSADIKTGQVAYTLGRPWSFPLKSLAEAVSCALSLMAPFALVGWLMGTARLGPWRPVSAVHAAAILLSLLLGLVLLFLCQFVLSMTAFWWEENAAFMWIHQKLALVSGTFLPLEFFPPGWRPWIERTPYGWLCYPPARLVVAFDTRQGARLLAGQLVWVLGLSALSILVFAAGSRRTAMQGG